jgi:2-polyprenyl-6-methoxyphenol hydroxylase-like FAD-dependent oxidoreductase
MIPTLPSWRSPSGRVILIGDAAHAIPPSGGQGGAMSFEDAESLAYALSTLKREVCALSSWETHRKERVKRVIDFNNMSAKLRQATEYSLVQTFREWFIWILLKMKGQEGYRWLYGYDSEVAMSML